MRGILFNCSISISQIMLKILILSWKNSIHLGTVIKASVHKNSKVSTSNIVSIFVYNFITTSLIIKCLELGLTPQDIDVMI